MEAINPLYHLNLSTRRSSTVESSFNISKYRKFNPVDSVKTRHAQIIKMPKKKDSDMKMQSLITSYLKFGEFRSASVVFFVGFRRNYLHWNSFLEDFEDSGGNSCEILEAFVELHNMGVSFGSETLAMVLKLSAKLRNTACLGLGIHVCLIKRGFDVDVYSKSALMNFYGSLSDLDSATKVFDESSDHRFLLRNEAVLVAFRNERLFEGLNIFRRMQFLCMNANNTSTVARVVQACGKVGALNEGKQMHGYIIRTAIEFNLSICNSLIYMYSRNGYLELARSVFHHMENRDLSTWNSIISGFAGHGYLEEAWELLNEMGSHDSKPDIVTWNSLLSGYLHHGLYQEVLAILQHMQNAGFNPNSRSITTVLQAVSELCYLDLGKAVHCYAIRHGLRLDSDPYAVTSLLDMYVKNNDLNSAQSVFDCIDQRKRNVFSWNTMVSGYSYKGDLGKTVSLITQMEREGVRPDLVTYSSMVSGYAIAGRADETLEIIRQMKKSGLTPNAVSWTALISGCSQTGDHRNAFGYCYQMQEEGVKPNSATIASLLRACAGLSLLQKGKEAHCFSVRNGYTEDAYVCTALINMYNKCGNLASAYSIFQRTENKTLASWNSMIMGFSTHGSWKQAESLFHEMREEKLEPDAITMTAVLTGCKNSGLIDEGWRFFDGMEREYGITPNIQHYSSMVDLLGRAGYLDEAWDLIEQMPVTPDPTVWGALLGSCKIHGDIQLGETAARKLFKLEPQNPANYVLLMNMYASLKRWDDVDGIKDLMDLRSVKLGHVWSWIEIDKKLHVFSAVGKPHQEDGEVYFELYHLVNEIKSMGYVPDTKCVHQNIDEEEKEEVLLSHTEKRAITCGLIKTKENTTIRVIKNATICADCHTFAAYVSLVRNREIILKDGIRFHHFVEGKCSCREFL